MYRKYKRRYKNYYNYNEPSILEDFFVLIFELAVSLGKLIAELLYKLVMFIFSKIRNLIFKTNNPIYGRRDTSQNYNFDKKIPIETPIESIEENIEVDQKYILKQSLLTPTEKIFSDVLEQIIGNDYRIEHQV